MDEMHVDFINDNFCPELLAVAACVHTEPRAITGHVWSVI